MSDDQKPEFTKGDYDLSDFGNLTPIFSNRFYAYRGSGLSRIFFGEMMRPEGESSYHTSIVLSTADLISLMKLIARLTNHRVEEQEESESDG